MLNEIFSIAPEIILISALLIFIIWGAFAEKTSYQCIFPGSVMILMALSITTFLNLGEEQTVLFNGLYLVDHLSQSLKAMIFFAAGVALFISGNYLRHQDLEKFEYPLLYLFSTLGMVMMVSANDLMSLYLSLELQSLALYVLVAMHRKIKSSTEAGLKYFVLGALASGFILYGCSFIYGFAGTTSFSGIASFLIESEGVSAPLLLGFIFLICGLAFKISAVPFHMWTPDVYEGAPTPVTAFLSSAPKIAAMGLLISVLTNPFLDFFSQWQQVISVMAIASMAFGSVAAIMQTNFKRLLAYSSIGHMGFALVGLSAGQAGIESVLIYMFIYLIMSLGTFACLLAIRQQDRYVENIADFAGLAKSQPKYALILAIFMFSMAGIPPLAGFFGKFYVFLAAIQAELYVLAVIGVLTSVISAFYYLRIVKFMYFDQSSENVTIIKSYPLRYSMTFLSIFTVAFIFLLGLI